VIGSVIGRKGVPAPAANQVTQQDPGVGVETGPYSSDQGFDQAGGGVVGKSDGYQRNEDESDG
jgi:hypothetical protein